MTARRVVRRALEALIERRVANRAALYGVVSIKLELRNDTGYPDRLFWIPGGRPLLIEFKRPGDVPTAKQEEVHATLRGLGYDVEVHDDYATAIGSVVAACHRARARG